MQDETQDETRYEVQHHTLCDGWVNTWYTEEEDGTATPKTFTTEAEAKAALDAFLSEVQDEADAGNLPADHGYSLEDFRIAPVCQDEPEAAPPAPQNRSSEPRPLTRDDKLIAFRRATSALPRCYASQIENGMTDDELAAALGRVLGIAGGSGARDEISIHYEGAGLKIWASWETPNHCTDAPICQGRQTVAMAREVYRILDPADTQMNLL